MIEILGYLGVIFTAISFLMNNMVNLRIFNLIACIIFVIYGFLKNDYPILIINLFVALINIYYLYKNNKKKQNMTLIDEHQAELDRNDKNNQYKSKYVPFISEVEEFNSTMGKPNNYKPTIPSKDEWMFVYNFILEELEEYKEACEKGDIVGVLDALCDITYVSTGNGTMLHGLKEKFKEAYDEVQASNMSKACSNELEAKQTSQFRANELDIETHYEKVGDKWVVYRSSDKKVLKNINYFKPNLKKFFTEEEINSCKNQ